MEPDLFFLKIAVLVSFFGGGGAARNSKILRSMNKKIVKNSVQLFVKQKER